jgi:hypothetical protein
MPSNDVATPSPTGPVVPPCTNCQFAARVHPLALNDVSPGIQYWRCDTCGCVWATHDGYDLRSEY